MQIKHVGLPVASNKPSDNQQAGGVSSSAGQQQSVVSGQGNDALFVSSMSGRRLDWLRVLLGNTDVSLFKDIKEMLGLLASIRTASYANNLSGLLNSAESAFSSLAGSLENKDFTATFVQGIIRLYLNAEEVKLDLLNLLVSLPKDDPQAAQLREKVSGFLNYLESVNFFNREGAQDTSKAPFLYFPFHVPSEHGKDKKLELVVYPSVDDKGKVRQDAFSFNIIVDTESMGRVKVFTQVNKNRVSCNVGVENPSAFSLFEQGAEDLSARLKKIRFVLNSFDCCEAKVEDYLPTLLPRLEMKA
jgi:hypothetical protein